MSIVEKAVGKHLGGQSGKALGRPRQIEPMDAAPDEDAAPVEETAPVEAARLQSLEETIVREPLDEQSEDFGRAVPSADGDVSGEIIKLDFERLRESSIVPPEEVAPNLAAEFRRIKRPLLKAAMGKDGERVENGNLIMLCSALSGEGKTFTSMNLAMSVALERERTVLLIDADVAKPHISRALQLQDRRGLMDVLVDRDLDLADVLVQTDMPGLRVLPAGQSHDYATELLASERMEEVINEIAGRYPNRIIILDSPPLLQTSEAQVLTGLVGQVVVVIHAGATPQSAIDGALELIDSSKHVSLILNKCRVATGGDHYYGGYYGQAG